MQTVAGTTGPASTPHAFPARFTVFSIHDESSPVPANRPAGYKPLQTHRPVPASIAPRAVIGTATLPVINNTMPSLPHRLLVLLLIVLVASAPLRMAQAFGGGPGTAGSHALAPGHGDPACEAGIQVAGEDCHHAQTGQHDCHHCATCSVAIPAVAVSPEAAGCAIQALPPTVSWREARGEPPLRPPRHSLL